MLCDHRCPDRIQIDIAMAGENVALAADEARLVAAFPQCSGASMPGVEFSDIESANALHHPRNGAGCFRRSEQVHVVRHQYVRVDRAGIAHRHFAQGLQIQAAVHVVEEAGHAIVATLYDVLCDAGDVGSWEASHGAELSTAARVMLSVSIPPQCRKSTEKAL